MCRELNIVTVQGGNGEQLTLCWRIYFSTSCNDDVERYYMK